MRTWAWSIIIASSSQFGQVRSKAFAFPGFYHKVFRAWMRVQCCGHSFCVTAASLLQNFWGDSENFRGKIVERILVVCRCMLCEADDGNWTMERKVSESHHTSTIPYWAVFAGLVNRGIFLISHDLS